MLYAAACSHLLIGGRVIVCSRAAKHEEPQGGSAPRATPASPACRNPMHDLGPPRKKVERTDLPLDALEMALCRQGIKKGSGLIHHSDRGSQYVSIRRRAAAGGRRNSLGRLHRGQLRQRHGRGPQQLIQGRTDRATRTMAGR